MWFWPSHTFPISTTLQWNTGGEARGRKNERGEQRKNPKPKGIPSLGRPSILRKREPLSTMTVTPFYSHLQPSAGEPQISFSFWPKNHLQRPPLSPAKGHCLSAKEKKPTFHLLKEESTPILAPAIFPLVALTLSQTDQPPLHTDLPLPSASSLPNGRSPKQENRLSLNQRRNPSLWKPSRRPMFFFFPWPKQLPEQHPPVHRPASTSRPHGRQQQGQPPLPPTGAKTTDAPPAPTACSPIFNHPDGNKQRRRWTQKKKALTEGDNGRSKRKRENKSEIYCLCCWVALQVTGRCTAGTWVHQFAGLYRRRHVGPRAASVPANSRQLPCSYCYV